MVAVLIASVAGFFFLRHGATESWQPIAEGREFSTSELAAVQSAWRQAGLKSSRRDARRLLVPSADLARFTAALPKSQRDDRDNGNEQGQSLAKANLFTSHEQLEQLKDNDLRATLRRHLKAIPAIADADVIWTPGKARSAFASRSKVKATIVVLPRDGHDLTPELAQSLRTAVAGMIPDLCAGDIVVLDQSTGLAVTEDSEQWIVEQQRHRQHERIARQLESRIAVALTHVPNATVQAKLVERPVATNRHLVAKPTFGSTVIWATDAPDNLVEFPLLNAAETDVSSRSSDSDHSLSWQVSVQIPQSYLDAHAVQRSLSAEHATTTLDELCEAECCRLQLLVQSLLPADATLAGLSIVPHTDQAVAKPSADSFTTWPHVLIGFFAVLCLTVGLRRQQTPVIVPSRDRSAEPSLAIAETLEAPMLNVREGEDAVVAPQPLIESVSDLARLQRLDPQPLAEALRHERPQAIAVLLTRFPTRLASACLSRFAASLQTDVIRRLKSLSEVPDELVAEIARAVCQRLASSEPGHHEPTNRIAHLLPEAPMQRVSA